MSRLRDRRTLARYATVAAIVLVIGALFARQQFFSASAITGTVRPGVSDAGSPAADGTATTDTVQLGMIGKGTPALNGAAPDFALRTTDGRVIRLSDFRGKTVVLNFWATWCPPCREEIPDFERAYQAREPRGDFVVLGVDYREPPGQVSGFIETFRVGYPVVIDADGSVTERYGLPGLPGTFFIDSRGIIRKEALGPVTGDLLPAGIAAADAAGAGAS